MPPRRNKEKFQQLMEFERERIIGLREGGFSYRATRARVKRNSSTVMRVWKQWTDEQALNNLKNWQWKTGGDVNARRSTPAPHGGE
ncbi:hypothetical protein TNCV_4227861 [Trichonephila clavipes]|nr:hypothetical protein TNCV_4227861 [Trichonephila clavipes]